MGVMAEAVKVTGRRQSSEVQDTSRKRKGDAGEEDETERGATSEDAAPRRVGRDLALDLGSETESGTSERKRQKRREEDAAPADWPDVLQGVWPLVRRDVNHTPPHSTLEQEAVPEKDPGVHEPDGRVLHDLRKEKELVAEQDTLYGLQPKAPHQPADALAACEVTLNIQVSPTPPQGLQTPPSTSDCQPRPSALISDVQDEPFSADVQQPQVQEPTSRCHSHPQVTPEDIMDPTVTNTALWHYLNNTERTEPVIGLSMMTEFQWPMENNALNYFRCHCCSRDIIRSQHMSHIISAKHRFNYIKKVRPRMVRDWPSSVEPNERPRELRDLAQQVERDEGWGRLKVTVMRSSTSQSPKATAKSPLKARVTSKTTDVSLKMNEDLKMILISKTVAELTELSKSCLTDDTSQTVYRGNVVTATPHIDAESTMTSDVPTEGNGINQSPNQGSQSSPMHILPPDTQPESPQSCDVQPESYEDPRRTQPWAPHDPMTQSRAPHDLMTQPWAPHDPMAQPWAPHDPMAQPWAPQIPGTWQQAPRDCDTQPWAPQYSSSAPWYQSAPQDPGGIQPQNPEEPRDRRGIKLEETQKPLACSDRQTFLDPEPPVCQSNSAGEMIASRVSLFLNVKLSEAERKRVVGLGSVLECQCGDISKNERLAPFYLCCSCLKTFQLQNIIGHIISLDHQLKYMWEKYPKMMAGIWNLEDLSEKDKMDDFEVMVNRIAEQEQLYQMDAEVILLDKDSYHRVRVASFNEGIHILESCRPPEADKSTDNEETDNIVKTEPVAEHMSDRPHPERVATMNTHNSTITVTIKQEVKQEDHTHSCFSGHTEMRKAVKHGLDDVSSNEDGETVKRRRISKSPDGRKLELVLNSLKILASSNFNLESPPLSPVSAASSEPWFTEPRTQTSPKPVDNIVTSYADRQFTSESQAADVIDYDQPPESYYRAAHPAAAGEDLPVASSPQLDCNQNFSVGEPSTVNTNPALASQAGIYNTTASPFNIGSITTVSPNPASQQFPGSDYRINQPTVAMLNPSVSLPAAGYYGTPVYPYSQLTYNPYFTHGYPSGTGPAGIHRAPEQHPVFSQYVNYSVGSTGGLNPVQTPPQQGTGQYVIPGGAYTTNPPAEAWLEMQRQQQPQ